MWAPPSLMPGPEAQENSCPSMKCYHHPPMPSERNGVGDPPHTPCSGLWTAWVSVRRQAQLLAPWSHNPSLCPASPGLAGCALAQWALETRAAGASPSIFPGEARGPQETEKDAKGGVSIRFFLGQIMFIEHPLCGRHCARCRGFRCGPSPSPSPHPFYLPDANTGEQNHSLPAWGLGLEWGAGEEWVGWGK